MANYYSSDFQLGVLGGGQLGKMLLTETRRYDIYTAILDPSDEAPCKVGSNRFEQGSLMDFDTVYNFGKTVDLLTIEIEHVNIVALEKLEQEGLEIHPSPKVLKTIQNKGRQKLFYKEKNIPTAPFELFSGIAELKEAVNQNRIQYPFVWKSTQFGYDGKGVSVIKNEEDLAKLSDGECIAEQFVDFEKELAVIVARNKSGEVTTYPVVEMEFHPTANLVEYVLCPSSVDSAIEDKARKLAINVAEAYGSTGLLAVELFLTKSGDILVNEVAPRVHNSGHYSIEGSYTSQFEQHLRAILNLPLGSTKNKVAAVMVNLVGDENHSGPVKYEGMEDLMKMEGVNAHLYGKKETRPFRKMGHVTIIDESITEAREKAEKAKNSIKVISTN